MNENEPKKNKKKKRIALIILLVLTISLGFAFLRVTLSIGGTATLAPHSWDVVWEIQDAYASDGVVFSQPTLDESGTSLTASYTLSKPGDYIELTINAVNNGTLDAMTSDLEVEFMSNNTVIGHPSYLRTYFGYSDGVPLDYKQILRAGQSEELKVRVQYNKDISSNDLPSSTLTLTSRVGVTYSQADSTAIEVRNVVYTAETPSSTYINNNSPMPSNVVTYDNPEDAMASWSQPFFLKHLISNGKVVVSYVGFEYDNHIYEDELKYGFIFYESNKAFISDLFQDGNMDIWHGPQYSEKLYLYHNSEGTLTGGVSIRGAVTVYDGTDLLDGNSHHHCFADSSRSYCR
ncbi:MAG: hypothetical protein IKF71_05890 [Bacilli bacterium]|nr:hypothetical protein [Bacilli bacterium]